MNENEVLPPMNKQKKLLIKGKGFGMFVYYFPILIFILLITLFAVLMVLGGPGPAFIAYAVAIIPIVLATIAWVFGSRSFIVKQVNYSIVLSGIETLENAVEALGKRIDDARISCDILARSKKTFIKFGYKGRMVFKTATADMYARELESMVMEGYLPDYKYLKKERCLEKFLNK